MNFVQIPNKDFEMADAPVTQAEWKELMGTEPSYFKDKPNHPVEQVSWNDVQEFIAKINIKDCQFNYRLPTQSEWEFCARSCDKQNIKNISWNSENSKGSTHPVKTKLPNELGLYDMLGNVWEWCSDFYSSSGSNRVVRGGSWNDFAQVLRSAGRDNFGPGGRYSNVGFRLVRTKFLPLNTDTLEPASQAEGVKPTDLVLAINQMTKVLRGIRTELRKMNDHNQISIEKNE